MTSEVEERPKLVTASYGRRGSQWIRSVNGTDQGDQVSVRRGWTACKCYHRQIPKAARMEQDIENVITMKQAMPA